MNRFISWIKRQGDANSVTYSRFGLPGDETDDRPPPVQIVVAPFDEFDKQYFIFGKIHVARAAVIAAGVGMSITLCIFLASFFEFNWYNHRRGVDVLALIGLILFLVCGVMTHWHVVVGVKKNHPKYLLPFIVVYVVMITAEGAMALFGIYHFSWLNTIDVPDHVFQTPNHARMFKEYHSTVTKQVLIGTLLFAFVFVVQGIMLWIILRCRQFLARKLIYTIEMRIAEKSKVQYPNIQIVHAPTANGFSVDLNRDASSVENGIVNREHESSHIGVVNDSIGTPPPSYARSQEEQHNDNAPPQRTLFSSSVE